MSVDVIKPNKELLLKTLEWVEEHEDPDNEDGLFWDQAQWRSDCGTAMCFAGAACMLNGDRFHQIGTRWRANGAPISIRAQEILGLSEGDAEALFYGENSLNEISAIVEEVMGRITVTAVCEECGYEVTVEMSEQEYKSINHGADVPELNLTERERVLIMSGMCGTCGDGEDA